MNDAEKGFWNIEKERGRKEVDEFVHLSLYGGKD